MGLKTVHSRKPTREAFLFFFFLSSSSLHSDLPTSVTCVKAAHVTASCDWARVVHYTSYHLLSAWYCFLIFWVNYSHRLDGHLIFRDFVQLACLHNHPSAPTTGVSTTVGSAFVKVTIWWRHRTVTGIRLFPLRSGGGQSEGGGPRWRVVFRLRSGMPSSGYLQRHLYAMSDQGWPVTTRNEVEKF
jgi:hypothetical protein